MFSKEWNWDFAETLKRYEEKIQKATKQINEILDYLEGDEPFLSESEVEDLYEMAKSLKKVLTSE